MKKYVLAAWIMALIAVLSCLSSMGRAGLRQDAVSEGPLWLCTTEDSDYLRYHDMITTLLIPHVKASIQHAYGDDFIIARNCMNIKSVDRVNGFRTFDFLIRLEVMPCRDDHRIIGLDHITLKLTHDNRVELVEHRHIRDY